MNTFELNCYQKTYDDHRYWLGVKPKSRSERYKHWSECRVLTDFFYDELVRRGYLVRIRDN
jgi:hypothetical protein